jgi:hypothetical protein
MGLDSIGALRGRGFFQLIDLVVYPVTPELFCRTRDYDITTIDSVDNALGESDCCVTPWSGQNHLGGTC